MIIAEWVYARFLRSGPFSRGPWYHARRLLVRCLNDPACEMEVHGRRLFLPLSHALPTYLYDYPSYDRLPGRLAAFLRGRYGTLRAVDVGANVGDTIAALHPVEGDSFLAVEPNPHFFRYLQRNWGEDPRVELLCAACSASAAEDPLRFVETAGTARLVAEGSGDRLLTRPLDDLLSESPRFREPNLLKVDTDGFDLQVLAGARGTIKRFRPAVLFECDSFGRRDFAEECLRTLRGFEAAGYDSVLIYDNYGFLMGSRPLSDLGPLAELLFYQHTSSFHYFDLLLLRAEDHPFFLDLERAHFLRLAGPAEERGLSVPPVESGLPVISPAAPPVEALPAAPIPGSRATASPPQG